MKTVIHAFRSRGIIRVLAFMLLTTGALAGLAQRQHILIVGSSTAYPIIAAAAEYVGRYDGLVTPVVESTGTGGGFKLFCSGVGLGTPDIAMASRAMKDIERASCYRNHVDDIREIKIGYDGIVLANAIGAATFALTKQDLYLALAREVPSPSAPDRLVPNPYHSWRQIRPDLPDLAIRVLGPPPTSGTRDILVERVLQVACNATPAAAALAAKDPASLTVHCQALREDGAFVDSGENDARLVRKLVDDPGALGILGYNFLDRNRDLLHAATVDGVAPTFTLIESGVYPLSRPLYIYVKPKHARVVGGLKDFVNKLLSPAMSGPEGVLVDQGLIPLRPEERANTAGENVL